MSRFAKNLFYIPGSNGETWRYICDTTGTGASDKPKVPNKGKRPSIVITKASKSLSTLVGGLHNAAETVAMENPSQRFLPCFYFSRMHSQSVGDCVPMRAPHPLRNKRGLFPASRGLRFIHSLPSVPKTAFTRQGKKLHLPKRADNSKDSAFVQ